MPGREIPKGEDTEYQRSIISPGFFATMGHPFVERPRFRKVPDNANALVVIMNRLWQTVSGRAEIPIGRKLQSGGRQRTIIGVVKSVKFYRVDKARPHLYFPYLQGISELDLNLCIKVEGDPKAFSFNAQNQGG